MENLVPVKRLRQCDDCGIDQLAWVETAKGWRLYHAIESNGALFADIGKPHTCRKRKRGRRQSENTKLDWSPWMPDDSAAPEVRVMFLQAKITVLEAQLRVLRSHLNIPPSGAGCTDEDRIENALKAPTPPYIM